MRMRSSNPALSGNVFQNFETYGDTTAMTVTGTVVKTMVAILLAVLTAGWTFMQFRNGVNVAPYMWGGMIVGLIAFFATTFKPNWAAITTPVYALAEGFFLGAISAFIQARFPAVPIVFQATGLTFGVLFVMLFAYSTGLIKVTEKLRLAIVACTGAVCLLYMVTFVLSFFQIQVPYIHGSGLIGIGFSLFVVGLAAFNLLLDFDLIDRMVAQRSPKAMEWYGAFALMVTLVWLYIEILRLLSKLQSRD